MTNLIPRKNYANLNKGLSSLKCCKHEKKIEMIVVEIQLMIMRAASKPLIAKPSTIKI